MSPSSARRTVMSEMDFELNLFTRKYGARSGAKVDRRIHPQDQMLLFGTQQFGESLGLMYYHKLGCDLAGTFLQVADWAFPGEADSIKVLEFACGYGRVLRHLVNCFPARNVTASDIMPKAVAFCAEQFGVEGKLSVHDPSDLHWSERYDLIVVPSLFSHLPDRTFLKWLSALYGLLTDRGVLAFSTHGDHVLPAGTVPKSGIRFDASSENDDLDGKEYGTSYVSEAYVREQVRRATGRPRYAYAKRGFCNFQDLYIVAKDPSVDVESFRYNYGILGYIDTFAFQPDGALLLEGWAGDTRDAESRPVKVEVLVDDRRVAQCETAGPRPEVAAIYGPGFLHSKFELRVPGLTTAPRTSHLVVEVVAGEDRETLYAMPLAKVLPERVRAAG
jgi:SAM-dependent methyltransferase